MAIWVTPEAQRYSPIVRSMHGGGDKIFFRYFQVSVILHHSCVMYFRTRGTVEFVKIFFFEGGCDFQSAVSTEIEEENNAETEEVAPGNKKEEKAEIAEIDAQEKAKEAQANAEIKDEGQKAVAKDEAEDKAAGVEEAKIEAEKAKEEAEKLAGEPEKKSGSWLSWLWPFGNSDDTKAEDNADAPEDEPKEEVAKAEEAPAEKEKVEEKTAEPVVEQAEMPTEEPVVEKEDSGSWFSWLWPFGSDDKKADAPEAEAAGAVAVAEDDKGVAVAEEVAVAKDKEGDKVEEVAVEAKDAEGDIAEVKEVVAEAAPAEPKVAGEKDVAECKEGCNVGRAILMWIPNILLNLTDVFSGGVAVGAEAGIVARITNYCQFGGQYGDAYFVEKGFDRRFGGGYDNGYAFHLAALTGEKRYVDKTFGGVKGFIFDHPKAFVNKPTDVLYSRIYQNRKKIRHIKQKNVISGQ